MIRIERATLNEVSIVCRIGYTEVGAAHRDSCSPHHLNEYLDTHYNEAAIAADIINSNHYYFILYYNNEPIGFSKIVLNQPHPAIQETAVTKLDRIYILQAYHDKKLGAELLRYNIEFAKQHQQVGMWLFTWIGNERAIRFYTQFGFEVIASHWFNVSKSHANENHQMLLRLTP